MKTVVSVLRSMGRSPVKSALTVITVGIGVAVLILSLSISGAVRGFVEAQISEEGFVLTLANARRGDQGQIVPVRPAQFDQQVFAAIESDVEGVIAVSPVLSSEWSNILAGGKEYRVRNAAAVGEGYHEVMGFEIISGSYFSAEDVQSGKTAAVITESLAATLFGSVEDAAGKTFSIPMPELPQGDGGISRRAFVPPPFTVFGVVADPDELLRRAYDIADMIVPYTSILPAESNVNLAMRFSLSTLQIRLKDTNMNRAEAQIRDVLTRTYGEDIELLVWEGTPEGESEYLAGLRETISTFALVGNTLGFVLLVIASIGILSIMLVEAIGRTREIALERALGASNRRIIREYFNRSVVISVISAAVGTALCLVFAKPLSNLVSPIFAGYSGLDFSAAVISVESIATAVVAASILGGVLGIFPVFSILKTPIAEGIREA